MNFLSGRPARVGQPLYLYLRGLLLWWLLPLALSAAAAVAVSVHELYENQTIRAQRWAKNLANAIDLELIRRLEGLRTVAALTAGGQRSTSMDAWAQSASTYHQHFGMPIMLVDAERRMLRHSLHPSGASLPALPASQGRRALEQALETGQAQIGDPALGPMLGKPVVQIMLPLPEQGKMLVGAVPSEILGKVLESQDLPRGWRATLLDSVGREVAATGLGDEQDLPFSQSARRASSALSAAPFQVALDVGPAVFYKDAIFLGGEMKVDSAPGQGSRFTLRAPAQVASEQAHVSAVQELVEGEDVTAAHVETSAATLRILLVDDHAMVRAGLRQLIISWPHLEVVGEAVNGMEAVVMARKLRPHVVVMDKSMPVLGGVGATRKILAENPAIVVLGMSMDDGDVLQQFEQAGAAGFFSKKDGAELLLQRLEIERLVKVGGGGGLMTLGRPPAGA